MRKIFFASGVFLAVATACSSEETTRISVLSHVSPIEVINITKNFDAWYHYTYYKVRLSRDFIALDTSGRILPKKKFLSQLATGKVLALPLATKYAKPVYQLSVYTGRDLAIRETSIQSAKVELSNCNRVGQKLFPFKFTDLDGVTYTDSSTREKTIVIKFWYTSCTACIDEFPQINALIEKYKKNRNIIFISFAMNDAKTLHAFVKNRQIKFSIIPVNKSYLVDTLKVFQYPTHFIINKGGVIAKVTNNADDLAEALEKEIHFTNQ